MRRDCGRLDRRDRHGARTRRGSGETGGAQERTSARTWLSCRHDASIAGFARTTLAADMTRNSPVWPAGTLWRARGRARDLDAETFGGWLTFTKAWSDVGRGYTGGVGCLVPRNHTLPGRSHGPRRGGRTRGGWVSGTPRCGLRVDEHSVGRGKRICGRGGDVVVILVSLAFAVEGVDGAGLVGKVIHGRGDGGQIREGGYGGPYLGRREGTRGSSPLEGHAAIRPLSLPHSASLSLARALRLRCPFVGFPTSSPFCCPATPTPCMAPSGLAPHGLATKVCPDCQRCFQSETERRRDLNRPRARKGRFNIRCSPVSPARVGA